MCDITKTYGATMYKAVAWQKVLAVADADAVRCKCIVYLMTDVTRGGNWRSASAHGCQGHVLSPYSP